MASARTLEFTVGLSGPAHLPIQMRLSVATLAEGDWTVEKRMGRMSGDGQGLGAPLPYLTVRSDSEQWTQARASVQDQRILQRSDQRGQATASAWTTGVIGTLFALYGCND